MSRLQNLKKITDNSVGPKNISHLVHKHIFKGFGPRQSLDQRITFINENINLADRITKIGRRPRYFGLDSARDRDNTSSQCSTRSNKKGTILPNLGSKFNRQSLNFNSRQKLLGQIEKSNIYIAQKLILTKPVISYDQQITDFERNQKIKSRIQRGNLRALNYSMLKEFGPK